MREKSLIILCVIFAILIGLVFFKKSIKPQVPTTEEIVDIIKWSVGIDSISEMTLRLGDGQGGDQENPRHVHLAKEGGRWVNKTQYGAFANDKVIKPALEKLDQLEGELRSDNAELFNDYRISGDKALHIILSPQEPNPVHFIVGLEKPENQSNFVRFAEYNAVYVVDEDLLSVFGVRGDGEDRKLDVEKWTDKHLLNLDVNKVVGVSITQTQGGKAKKVIDIKKELTDDKQQWQSAVAYDFGLSASNIKRVVETFNNTYAREVIAPDVEGAFDEISWSGVFTLEDAGEVKLVRSRKKSGDNYYAKVEGAGYYYLVPTSTFHSRQDQQGNIFADNPLKVEENTVSAVKIRSLNTQKEFDAVKKAPEENNETVQEGGDDQKKAKEEDAWETPDGQAVEITKVRDIINKLKALKLEAALPPAVSLKDSMTISIMKNGTLTEYSVSEDVILDTGKECRFLNVKGGAQSYCVSKSSITSLQNALP